MNSTNTKQQALPPFRSEPTPQAKKSSKELRKFGITMAVAFGVIGSFLLWKDKSAWVYLGGLSGFFLIFGLILPQVLRPIEYIWMKVAQAIGSVMTRVILSLTFFLVITPVGLIMRLSKYDPLQLKFREPVKSYWVEVEEDGPCSRPEKPY